MIFKVRHKMTNEIRLGQWDSEYLNFLSTSGNITWIEYNHWIPCENSVTFTIDDKKERILTIYNPILFIDMEITLKDRSKTIATIPLKVDKCDLQFVEFYPLVGRFLFWKCSYYGEIQERKETVYQKPIETSYEEMINRFVEIMDLVCNVCLGIDQHMCLKCRKQFGFVTK